MNLFIPAGRSHGVGVVTAATSVVACLLGVSVSAASLDAVKIDPKALEAECSTIDGEHAVSIQAATYYATTNQQSIFHSPPNDKTFHSFDCGGAKSTIYYYEYPTKSDAKTAADFAKSLIWGGNGPSKGHPEAIVVVGNVLVVISSATPKVFKKQLK